MSTRFSVAQKALLGCTIPIATGCICISGCFVYQTSNLLLPFCFMIGGLLITSALIGVVGVKSRNAEALEASRNALILINLMAFVFGLSLLLACVLVRIVAAEGNQEGGNDSTEHTGRLQHLSSVLRRQMQPVVPTGGLVFAVLVMIGSTLSFFSLRLLGQYQQNLDVEQLVIWHQYLQQSPPGSLIRAPSRRVVSYVTKSLEGGSQTFAGVAPSTQPLLASDRTTPLPSVSSPPSSSVAAVSYGPLPEQVPPQVSITHGLDSVAIDMEESQRGSVEKFYGPNG